MKLFHNKAFTLVEVILTAFIFMMIMGALYGGLVTGGRSWQTYDAMFVTQGEVRRAVYTLNRDLRMANNIIFKEATDTKVEFSFRHPDDGTVTYSWTKEDGNARQIIRKTDSRSRIIAQNITGFEVKESGREITYSVKAGFTSKNGVADALQLDGKVVKR